MARDTISRGGDLPGAGALDELIALAGNESLQDGGRMRKLNTSLRETSAIGTLKKIRPVLSRFGVSEIIDITLDGVPACPAFQVMREDIRSEYFNAGKGYTRAEAMVSGLMEALEVHCFEHADPSLLHASAAGSLPLVPTADLLGRKDETADGSGRSGEGKLVRGVDHRSGSAVWIDARDVFFGLAADGERSAASSNGIASGNSVPEALCHAIGELLERHALAALYRFGIGATALSGQQHERVVPPPEAENLWRCLRQLKEKDISAEFLHVSSEADVAVFVCFLDLPYDAARRAAVEGFGANPDPQIAMARALAEAVQILALCPVNGAGEAGEDASAPRTVMTTKQAAAFDAQAMDRQRLRAHGALTSLRERLEPIDYEYLPIHDRAGEASRSTAEELQKLVQGLRRMGCDRLYSCVISPPDLPVVVVKCFCPGLDTAFGL
ncbi:YcaO-like family protein [Massilia sp. DD77]|uniref:YcaO-like family protein n=1 Tax=Massilia sp. DD77 TaxID=3109349 RepID=UPI002FFD93FE